MTEIQEIKELIKSEGDRYMETYKGIKIDLVRDKQMLYWCAYIIIPKTLEFASFLNDTAGDIPYFGSPNQVWTFSDNDADGNIVLGIDCAHAGMMLPGLYGVVSDLAFLGLTRSGRYWTQEDCIKEMRMNIDKIIEFEIFN